MALLWNVVKLQGRHLLTGTMNGGGSRTPSSQLFFTAKKKCSYSLNYCKTFRHPQKAATIIFTFWRLPPYLTVGFSASLLPTQRQAPRIFFFTPSTDYILTSDDTEPGSSGTEGAERVHSWLWTATPCIQTTFPVSIALCFWGSRTSKVCREASRKEDSTYVLFPTFCISRESSHKLVPNRGKSAGSEHCCRSGGQKNATPDIHWGISMI